jgi:hypothetical protein
VSSIVRLLGVSRFAIYRYVPETATNTAAIAPQSRLGAVDEPG